MKIISTNITGCYEILPIIFNDLRGTLTKTFHEPTFKEAGLDTIFKEQLYTVSDKNVVRGMHFQIPPYDHSKLIYCVDGEINDFVLDLRVGSPSYGEVFSTILNSIKQNMVYIPSGCAHGYCTSNHKSKVVYSLSTVYNPENDSGVRWDTVGIKWPLTNPILSEKDSNLPTFENFSSPFLYKINK